MYIGSSSIKGIIVDRPVTNIAGMMIATGKENILGRVSKTRLTSLLLVIEIALDYVSDLSARSRSVQP